MPELISLPASPGTVRRGILPQAYALLPPKMASVEADVMLLAIGLQESRFKVRRQIRGPARGFWQFERGGGVRGVLTHESSKQAATQVCAARNVPATADAVYPALAVDDVLAAAFARLLLYTDPRPLPALGRVDDAWDYYIRNWRPGKPHPVTWADLYSRALAATVKP